MRDARASETRVLAEPQATRRKSQRGNMMRFATIFGYLVASQTIALAQAPRLAVYPPDVNLETARDTQTFVVQATDATGITRDVTALAKVEFANPALARRDGHTVLPVADGKTEMAVSFDGQTVKVPVTVTKAAVDRPISFKQDVMPVFMRAGCNSGGCHGAARGKDGFRLSLFGFDPDGDYSPPDPRIQRPADQPRFSRVVDAPRKSLRESAAHRRQEDQRRRPVLSYDRSLARGRRPARPAHGRDAREHGRLPARRPCSTARASTQRLVVRAKYSDGTDRDVTEPRPLPHEQRERRQDPVRR